MRIFKRLVCLLLCLCLFVLPLGFSVTADEGAPDKIVIWTDSSFDSSSFIEYETYTSFTLTSPYTIVNAYTDYPISLMVYADDATAIHVYSDSPLEGSNKTDFLPPMEKFSSADKNTAISITSGITFRYRENLSTVFQYPEDTSKLDVSIRLSYTTDAGQTVTKFYPLPTDSWTYSAKTGAINVDASVTYKDLASYVPVQYDSFSVYKGLFVRYNDTELTGVKMTVDVTNFSWISEDVQTGLLESIKNGILGIGESILNGLKALFIPSDTNYFDYYFMDWEAWLFDHFGALYYPFDLFMDIFDRFFSMEFDSAPSITFPGVTLMGHQLWEDTVYTFDFSDLPVLGDLHETYLIVVDVLVGSWILSMCLKKLFSILKEA